MRLLVIVFLLFTICNCHAQALWSDSIFVHRENQKIVNGYGNEIELDGVNLGGWLIWESWIWGSGFVSESTVFSNLTQKVGIAAANQFRDSVYANYIKRKDIQAIAQQCFNVVRIPFNHTILEDDSNPFVYKNSGWQILDSVLQWCEDYDVYAVLDLHAAPGGQSDLFIADPDSTNLWESVQNRQRTVQLWKAIAQRYKNRGIIAGYDLLNEPNTTNNGLLLNLYQAIIDTIRSVDTNHLFFVEGNNYAKDFSMFTGLLDANMAFEFHLYTWFNPNVAQILNNYTTISQNLNVPFWCGEWGEDDLNTLETNLQELQSGIYNISGHAFWTWKKQHKLIQNPCYQCYTGTADWKKLITWIGNNNAPEPTTNEAIQGISDFINNIKLANCNINTSVNAIIEACTLALKDKTSIVFSIYPNPAKNVFYIQKKNSIQCDLYIYNALGQLMYSISFSKNEVFVTLNNLKKGTYFVVLRSDEKMGIQKLIIG